MKIRKLDESLTESKKKVEEEKINEAADSAGVVNDAQDASKQDIAAAIVAGAGAEGKAVDAKELDKEVDAIQKIADSLNKVKAVGDDSEVWAALTESLEACGANRTSAIDADYPDLLLVGLAGFAKTARVKQFAKAAGIKLVEIKASTVQPEELGGLFYPVTDTKTGQTYATKIQDVSFAVFDEEPTILFLDEVNRSRPESRDALLGLINEHDLPITWKDEQGKWHKSKHYDKLLFSVLAMNPAGDLFDSLEDIDDALYSRIDNVIEVGANKSDLMLHFRGFYDSLLQQEKMTPELRRRYEGQRDIAMKLLGSEEFAFDDADALRQHVQDARANKMVIRAKPFNYRSFTKALINCDGTKDGFLKRVSRARFSDDILAMFKNILETYKDKEVIGNQAGNFDGSAGQEAEADADPIDTSNQAGQQTSGSKLRTVVQRSINKHLGAYLKKPGTN